MRMEHNQQSGEISRRQFLGALGIGAVALGTSSVLPGHAQQRFVLSADRFGRLFPQLPAFFDHATESLRGAMREMGQEGGILDAKDALDQGPLLLITNPALSVDNPNHPTHTAGTTFMGQFMDHDMTFDLTSRLGVPTQPEASVNTRTPALDLDSVYGGGPDDDPDLYTFERGHAPKFKIGFGGLFEDLPRTANRSAIIADPRNDENLMLAGLHAAFLLFHNQAVDYVEERDHRAAPDEVFSAARRLTRWHYQWMILHEFLPLFIGQSCVDDILSRGRQFYRPREAFMPVEFQGAVYRFGHTLVRPSYRANLAGDNGAPFFGMIFDPAGQGQADPIDLRGGVCARRRFIGWQTFFDFGPTFTDGPDNPHPAIRTNKMVDTHISTPLFRLPLAAIASGDPPISLPQRNLLRHITWSLPSGQSIARAMGLPSSQVLSSRDLAELTDFGHSLAVSTPLWYYALKEGEVVEGGLRLRPVGGRIVGEVIIGLLQLDQHSYLAADPRWRPTLPTRSGQVTGDFKMIDFLTFAGVAPDQRGQ
jgi:Animal haem peroxidase